MEKLEFKLPHNNSKESKHKYRYRELCEDIVNLSAVSYAVAVKVWIKGGYPLLEDTLLALRSGSLNNPTAYVYSLLKK